MTGLPRLLAGLGRGDGWLNHQSHERVHGALPQLSGAELVGWVDVSGLRGRGGADFPTATKLREVLRAARLGRTRPSAVVINASETEPISGKDRLLLSRVPHLVLDGATIAAQAIDADRVIVKVSDHGSAVLGPLTMAIAERVDPKPPIIVVRGPSRYVAGEESAVINLLSGGDSLPTFGRPRPSQRGFENRPTLVQNTETFAQIALIARHGPTWFRQLGTEEDPGTVLITISGDVRDPGVREVQLGTTLGEMLELAGGVSEPPQALLIGGYFGAWTPASPQILATPMARTALRMRGLSLGAGIVAVLGRSRDGLQQSARTASYLARESSGQCGPCVHGLAAVAHSLAQLADGTAPVGEEQRLRRWCDQISGRGACHHPTGAVRYVRSALDTFVPQAARKVA